jgi:pyruvate ferredoxin oxidoreductase alpha subunit
MTAVLPKIQTAFDEFEKLSGRKYNLVETYNMEDAEVAVVCMGTSVETAREVAEEMRAQHGIKAGVVGIRVFRPWPLEQIAAALKNVKAIGALDRSSPHGTVGALFNEISGSLFNAETKAVLTNYIYGLGGRDLTKAHLVSIFKDLKANADAGKVTTPLQQYIGLRGPKLSFF